MSKLLVYPGAILTSDVVSDQVVRVISLTPTEKEWTFDDLPDLVDAGRYQLDVETQAVLLDEFIPLENCTIMGVVNVDNTVQTVFENELNGHTFFKIIAADRFQVNIFDAGQIEDDLPFTGAGRRTIGFILVYDPDVHFYLFYNGAVASYTQAGATPSVTDDTLELLKGRWERLESYTGEPAEILSEFEYLFLGTNLSGTEVSHAAS